jgi:hypothetical protein
MRQLPACSDPVRLCKFSYTSLASGPNRIVGGTLV